MKFDIRKVTRWILNVGALVLAVLTLPEAGVLIPEAWLPVIMSATAVINLILTTIRKYASGEAFVEKPF